MYGSSAKAQPLRDWEGESILKFTSQETCRSLVRGMKIPDHESLIVLKENLKGI